MPNTIYDLDAFVPNDELFCLFRKLHHLYQKQVLELGKLYDRFVKDFLCAHKHIETTDVASLNAHEVNYSIIEDILENRYDLVVEYFDLNDCTEEIYIKLIIEYQTVPYYSKTYDFRRGRSFNCTFNDEQYEIVCSAMNELRLFPFALSKEEVVQFFRCKVRCTLFSCNNRVLARFFHTISDEYITPHWELVIETHKLIYKRNSKTPIRGTDLSSALTDSHKANFEKRHCDDLMIIKRMLENLHRAM